jgi:hypothetical protein
VNDLENVGGGLVPPPPDAAYHEVRSREVAAPRHALWEAIADLGGDNGYYALDPAWQARALLDRVLGGPGMRGRDPELRPGAALDFWRVVDVVEPRRLLLRAEMRMPGTSWLELATASVSPERSLLTQRVWFQPANVLGHVQWWAELAGHKLVFRAMLDGIAREAERRAA